MGQYADSLVIRRQHFPMDDNASEFGGGQGFLKIQQLIVRRSSRE